MSMAMLSIAVVSTECGWLSCGAAAERVAAAESRVLRYAN